MAPVLARIWKVVEDVEVRDTPSGSIVAKLRKEELIGEESRTPDGLWIKHSGVCWWFFLILPEGWTPRQKAEQVLLQNQTKWEIYTSWKATSNVSIYEDASETSNKSTSVLQPSSYIIGLEQKGYFIRHSCTITLPQRLTCI